MEPSLPLADPFSSLSTSRSTKEYLQIDSWVYAAVEEYKSLRTESLDSMKIQNTILSYGVSAVVLILTAGIGMIDKDVLSIIDAAIFLVLIPTTIFFIVMIWAGEVARMYRAGSFLIDRELIVSEYVGSVSKPALSWENWLIKNNGDKQAPHKKLYVQHYSVLAMFLLLAFLSVTIGNYKLGIIYIRCLFLIDIVEAGALVCLAILALSLLRYFHPSIARSASELVVRWYSFGKEVIFRNGRRDLGP
jgi:hypothetical protein